MLYHPREKKLLNMAVKSAKKILIMQILKHKSVQLVLIKVTNFLICIVVLRCCVNFYCTAK